MSNKKDLIEHISENLRSHHENYEQGAWENFVEYEKKKKKVFPLYWAAAACFAVLLGAGIFYLLTEKKTIQNNVVFTDNTSSSRMQNNIPDSNIALQNPQDSAHSFQNNIRANNNTLTAIPLVPFTPAIIEKSTGSVQLRYSADSAKAANNFAYSNIDTSTKQGQISTGNYYAKTQNQDKVIAAQNSSGDSGKLNYFPHDDLPFEQKLRHHEENDMLQHWSVAAVLAPSVSNNSNKVNMGYGVAVDYNISNRVSLNSGVSYTQLTGYSATGATSGAQSVQANVTGLSVPLELRFHIGSRVYIGAGASALAVLSNKQQRNYVVNNVETDAFTSNNGNVLATSSVLAEPAMKASEDIPQSLVGNQNIAGFFNFSIGIKQKLGAKTNFSIEPFVSLPMNNNFSKQNIHLTNGGIRLKIGL